MSNKNINFNSWIAHAQHELQRVVGKCRRARIHSEITEQPSFFIKLLFTMPQVENDPKIHYKYHLLWSVRSLQVFKCFFYYDVRLGTKSIITFRVVCFFCVKRQKVPATDEITGKHENQITPKPIILQPIFSEFLKNNFLLSFKKIWRFKINITYSNAKVVHHKNW